MRSLILALFATSFFYHWLVNCDDGAAEVEKIALF